jgi:hypothetical protein
MAENDHPRPPRIGWNDIADARARLRGAGIGLPDLSVAEILHEPLGPETLCRLRYGSVDAVFRVESTHT